MLEAQTIPEAGFAQNTVQWGLTLYSGIQLDLKIKTTSK